MPFSIDDLENLRRDLAQLPPNRPQNVSNRDAVVALTSELAAAQRLGYSVQDLAQLLSGKGLRMTAGTLKGYLQQARKKRLSKKSAKSKQTAPTHASGEPTAPSPTTGTTEAPASAAPSVPPRPAANGPAAPRAPETANGKGMATAAPPPPSPRRG